MSLRVQPYTKCGECGDKADVTTGHGYLCSACWMDQYGPPQWRKDAKVPVSTSYCKRQPSRPVLVSRNA